MKKSPRPPGRFCRLILGSLLACCVLMVVGITLYAWWVGPDDHPEQQLASISRPVRITFDQYNIPTIHAETTEDAWRTLGWLHARHRLFQMEMMRRTGQGRLAEWLGPSALKFDRYIRGLDLYALAQKSVNAAPAEEQQALKAYADGVNAWLGAQHMPPLELFLIGLTGGRLTGPDMEPWQPADSIVWGKLMALQLSGNLDHEITRARLLQYLSPADVSFLTRFDQDVKIPALPHFAGHILPRDQDWQQIAAAIPMLGPDHASNAWVINGTHTTTGKPILANDPHLGLNAPILWYPVRIETPDQTLTGVTVPGVPFHILGQNRDIAWGFTTTGSDVEDLVIEKTVPGKPGLYQTEHGPAPFTTRTMTFHVKGGKTETRTIRSTRHGIILSDIRSDMEQLNTADTLIALQTTLTSPDDTTWRALYHLNRAHDPASFVSAVNLFMLGQQNIFYADRNNNIGFYTHARLPIRQIHDGSVPIPGWTGQALWKGWRPAQELPPVFNPDRGFLANANDPIEPPGTNPPLTTDWEAPWRARRIFDVLSTPQPHSLADQTRLMTDSTSNAARALLPAMLDIAPDTALQKDILAHLTSWDMRMDRDRPEPLIFTAWVEAIQEIALEHRDIHVGALLSSPDFRLIERIITTPDAGWCMSDNNDNPAHADCRSTIQRALTRALARLQITQGDDWHRWRWGDAHKANFAHQILGQFPVIGGLFTWQGAMSGAADTVLRGASWGEHNPGDYRVNHAAGYRAVYDLSNPDQSLFMIATGTDGRPFHRHFMDLMPQWIDGQFIHINSQNPPQHEIHLTP